MVVGFQPQVSAAVQEIFNVEITDESCLRRGPVAVAEVAVYEQAVVEQAGGESQIHLSVGEVSFVAAERRRDAPFVGNLSEDVCDLG